MSSQHEVRENFVDLIGSMSTYIHTPVRGRSRKDPQPTPDTYRGHKVPHGGNLSQHSIWSMMYIDYWKEHRSAMTEGVDIRYARLGAFFHDIGKGGDCVTQCSQGQCWRNIYTPGKYGYDKDGKPHSSGTHPKRCGDLLMGKVPYVIDCSAGHKVSIPKLIKKYYPDIDHRVLAVSAYMHYDFGMLELGKGVKHNVPKYVSDIARCAKACGVRMSLKLVKLCMAVSAADMAGASNKALPEKDRYDVPEVYNGTVGWIQYGFDRNGKKLRDMVLAEYRARYCRGRSAKKGECAVTKSERTYK